MQGILVSSPPFFYMRRVLHRIQVGNWEKKIIRTRFLFTFLTLETQNKCLPQVTSSEGDN